MDASNLKLINPNEGRSSSKPREDGVQIKWQPPIRSLALRSMDWAIFAAAIFVVLVSLVVTLIFASEPEEFIFIPMMLCWVVLLLLCSVVRPTRIEVPFDHWVIIKRFGQPHRMMTIGWAWYFRLFEEPLTVKSMRSEKCELTVKGVTADGFQITLEWTSWIKPGQCPKPEWQKFWPMAVAYRLDKAAKKVEQFGVKIIQALISANSLAAIHHLQREFAALVDQSLAEELDTYFHIVRDGSIRRLILPNNYQSALQDNFLVKEELDTAKIRAEIEGLLITGPFKMLLEAISSVSGPVTAEMAMQLYYTYVLPNVARGQSNTVVLPAGMSDVLGRVAGAGAALSAVVEEFSHSVDK